MRRWLRETYTLKKAPPPSCQTCSFWHKTNLFQEGECRRHSPVRFDLVVGNDKGFAGEPQPAYPHTNERHWCGDYSQRKP